MPDAPDHSNDRAKLSSLEKLKLKRDQIDAQIRIKESRAKEQARRDDTRRKIIAGALALEHTEKNPDGTFARKMNELLDEYVVTDRERHLFGMAPLPAQDHRRETRADARNTQAANDTGHPRGSASPATLKDQFPS